MFSYQCRYCKATFDHWEKLVSHRSSEHRDEFEALKSALLEKKGESSFNEVTNNFNHYYKFHYHGLIVESLASSVSASASSPLKRKMKMRSRTPIKLQEKSASNFNYNGGGSFYNVTPRKTPPKGELDAAKDLEEGHEISLRIPSATSTSSTNFNVPLLNHNHTTNNHFSTKFRNNLGLNLTPPSSPPQVTPPTPISVSKRKAVLYHQINDSDEIEICTVPNTSISINMRHHNGNSIGTGGSGGKLKLENGFNFEDGASANNQVVIEEFDNELQFRCSSSSNRNGNAVAVNGNSSNGRSTAVNDNQSISRKRGHNFLKDYALVNVNNVVNTSNGRKAGKSSKSGVPTPVNGSNGGGGRGGKKRRK